MYETIGSPVTLGNVTLKNRIVFAPTTLGGPNDAYLERIEKIAAGGCGMIIIGDVPVLSMPFGNNLYTESGFAFYEKLAETAHKYGCKICAQLHQDDTDFGALRQYAPQLKEGKLSQDDLRQMINDLVGPYVTNMPVEKVRSITSAFGDAAVLAKKAGFDVMQVHGDRMCGSFASPLFNQRTDNYGGSLENRARFLLEAVEAVRKAVPDMPIDVKLAVRMEQPRYGKAGFTEDELKTVVPMLEKAGADSFHVSLANHAALSDTIPPANHPYFHEEGCFLRFCDIVKQYTNLPVCGVGGLTSPAFVEEQLKTGRIDCAAMSRQLLADPQWPEKVLTGREKEIRRCVRCNKDCLSGMMRHEGTHCIYEKGGK